MDSEGYILPHPLQVCVSGEGQGERKREINDTKWRSFPLTDVQVT